VSTRRGRLGTVCARVAWPAWVPGPSTSPLERSMRTHFASGVIAGALALCLCQWLSQWWGADLVNVPSGDPQKWRVALMMALSSTASVVPGLCAGFIAGRRGFLVGALAGALGSFLYGAFLELMLVHSGALRLNTRTWTAVFIFPRIYSLGLIVTSAVGGGAGQVLRSNNRWRGP
jgi:hypothetical protein